MSKRTYKEQLIKLGLNEVDGAYDISYAVEKCHEAFTLLSDEQRLIIQDMWGSKFIAELERFGRYTDKQSNLVQAPAILFRELTDKEEQDFRYHARSNYVIDSPIDEVWHPHYQDECKRMNAEV
tara:strand:- start:47 stop:418 length:372 start_codon:yes stop_codon:yes gene_type:complete